MSINNSLTRRQFLRLSGGVAAMAALAACAPPAPQAGAPAAKPTAVTSMSYDQALVLVQECVPAKSYMTNEFLPTGHVDGPTPEKPAQTRSIKVGLAWIGNDEFAQLYIAQAQGYFAAEGLEVELVPGGPGIDHLKTLGGGVVDVAIAAGGDTIPAAHISTTPIDLVAVGTLLKDSPGVFITIDPDKLGRELTPKDFVGVVGVQPAADIYALMVLDVAGLARNRISVVPAGFTPDVLLAKKANWYLGWLMNQPRLLDEQGIKWNALRASKFTYSSPSDTIAVRRETVNSLEGQDMVRRFLRAVYRGTQFMLEKPQEAATITAAWVAANTPDVTLTPMMIEQRFELQQELVVGTDPTNLLSMNDAQWDRVVATNVQYGLLQLPESCK